MLGKRPILGSLLAIAIGYAAYPYVTLYRLGQAIRQGDAPALQSMVDWSLVREGIKEDICDLVVDEPSQTKTGGQLPPFGASFVRGIAANAVDERVTPEALLAVAAQQPMAVQPVSHGAAVQVSWAFFTGPGSFVVDLHAPGQGSPIRLRLELRSGTWQVTRVWLPAELLGKANTRT